MCPFFFDFRRKCPTVGFERASWKCESGLITVALKKATRAANRRQCYLGIYCNKYSYI